MSQGPRPAPGAIQTASVDIGPHGPPLAPWELFPSRKLVAGVRVLKPRDADVKRAVLDPNTIETK